MGRTIFRAMLDQLKFSGGRFYSTLYQSQYTGRFWFVVAVSALVYTRYRAETSLGYQMNITDYDADDENKTKGKERRAETVYKRHVQHSKLYLPETTTVAQLKERLTNSSHPLAGKVRIGCKGRMMSDADNVANAVKCFCRRDPQLVAWIEDFD